MPDDPEMKPAQSPTRTREEGKIIGSMLVRGLPGRGEGRQEYEEVHRAAQEQAEESVAKARVPKALEGMVKRYFDSIAPESLPDEAPAQADED
jgi:hypothetical protein